MLFETREVIVLVYQFQ